MKLFFGPWSIHATQVFYETAFSLAIVNIKPIVPGHVLIISKRVEPRLFGLSGEEYADLFDCVKRVAPKLENFYKAEALNIAIQDGEVAGQSVPHVHVHILPRKAGDFKRNDDVYEELEKQRLEEVFDPQAERRARTLEEMAAECFVLRELFAYPGYHEGVSSTGISPGI